MVKTETEEAGYDWDKLSSAQQYIRFMGKDLSKVQYREGSLLGGMKTKAHCKSGAGAKAAQEPAADNSDKRTESDNAGSQETSGDPTASGVTKSS